MTGLDHSYTEGLSVWIQLLRHHLFWIKLTISCNRHPGGHGLDRLEMGGWRSSSEAG